MKILSLLVFTLCLAGFSSCKKDEIPDVIKSWKVLTPMPTARYNFGFVECNNLLYAIGGYNADALKNVEVYNPANDTWQSKANMPTARGYFVVASVSNKIYAIGGISGQDLNNIDYTNVTEEYDPALDKWTTKSPFPITDIPFNNVLGNKFLTGAAINGKIYVTVGTPDLNVPTYIYDPVNDSWTGTGKPIGKFNFEPIFATSAGSRMFVTNGSDFLQYSPVDNEWSILQPFLAPRSGACLSSNDTSIYSAGGYNMNSLGNNNYEMAMSGDVEAYDIANSTWTKMASLNRKRHSAAAVTYSGNLYIAGGAERQANYTDIPLSVLEVLSLK